jgi:catechol 2,3-dioxygenase-like lactoylglutathione lyase family enzyme
MKARSAAIREYRPRIPLSLHAGYVEDSLIDHVSIAVRDLERAAAFYEAVLARIGYAMLEVRPKTVGFGKRYPELWLNLRPEMFALPADSGAHVCLRAPTPAAVDAFHAAALAAGGASDGAPGLRPHHGEGYYAAFIRDPDGNHIEAVTFLVRSQ